MSFAAVYLDKVIPSKYGTTVRARHAWMLATDFAPETGKAVVLHHAKVLARMLPLNSQRRRVILAWLAQLHVLSLCADFSPRQEFSEAEKSDYFESVPADLKGKSEHSRSLLLVSLVSL